MPRGNPGHYVKTKDGKMGRTYNSKGLVNGKTPVYLETEKFKFSDQAILYETKSLHVLGMID